MVHEATVMLSLLVLLLTLNTGGADVLAGRGKEKKVLALQSLEGERSSFSQVFLPQRSRRAKGIVVLEMMQSCYYSGRKQTQEDKLQKLLNSDESRATFLQTRMRNAISGRKQIGSTYSSQVQLPLTSGANLQILNYVVTIELGGKKMTVIVDTGSDLTWIQCKPCFSCYNQQDPLFDPYTSPSYQAVPCNSTTCSDFLQLATGTSGICGRTDQASCNYFLSYGDGSYTRGVLGQEEINLGGTSVENFIFGCGRSNHGLFGGTSGLMGLGRTQLSLVSQTSAQFGGVFSYCLPTKEFYSSGSLVLGNDVSAYKNSTPIQYTRLISDPQQQPFYFLNHTGISVGDVPLQIPGFSSRKILIDSGTVITRLVPSVYKVLKVEFLKQLSEYPTAPAFSILDTCFNLSGYQEVNVPALKLQFEGDVEVNVDVTGILYFVRTDASHVCLAFASLSYDDEVGILGNYQQKNLRVVYDTKGSRLGFAEETCAYS